MNYEISAIPTKYQGVQFRSRLEARWAAFFSLCGIEWDYEPLDLNGWIPDFVIRTGGKQVLIEVKPIDPDWSDEIDGLKSRLREYISNSNRVWVLGAFMTRVLRCCHLIGFEVHKENRGAPLIAKGTPDFAVAIQSSGLDLKGSAIFPLNSSDPWPDPKTIFNEAGNLVQWRKTR